MFTRLDTHLKRNAICKSIPYLDPHVPNSSTSNNDQDVQPLSKIHILANTQQLSPNTGLELPPTHNMHHRDLFYTTEASSRSLSILNLPPSPQEWDKFMQEQLVPAVLLVSSPEAKNRILSEDIYDYFQQNFGTRQQKCNKRQRRRIRQDKALKKVKELKNMARRDFQKAKKQGLLAENIQPLAQKFFKLIREHNHLKNTSSAMKDHDQDRKVRHSCHRHFWQFSKQLLDDNSINVITPNFTQQEAHEFFKKVYHAEPRNFVQPA